jgi:Histidine kinase-, DNA gyrase B-, and HSP90-like ATPase
MEPQPVEQPPTEWPPSFTLDQEAILNLLTGDRFYSNPSAALREAILNAIDAVHRRRRSEATLSPRIAVTFDRKHLQLAVDDNGVGMSQAYVSALFTKVGASAASAEASKQSVGEFGIGVISYFMASDAFELQTYDGVSEPIGLGFTRAMLAGGKAALLKPSRTERGTIVTLHLRDEAIFNLLLESYAHWCRDVDGLEAVLLPESRRLTQGSGTKPNDVVGVSSPAWVERTHLRPVAKPTGWEAMTGTSSISVLYRGVFVQEFEVRGLWGIEGSIDVDPKFFKPRLNREGFVAGQFQSDVEQFLRSAHPDILVAMAGKLASAVAAGQMDKWSEKRWATLWLAVPRDSHYSEAATAWDAVFRAIPAFEVAAGNRWEPAAIDRLISANGPIYVAPLADENPSDLVKAATRLLRTSGHTVVRGIRRDRTWMRYAGASYGTTADLITNVFAHELPPLEPIVSHAQSIVAGVKRIAPLFSGPPPIDLVRLGSDTPPALRLPQRLVINVDHLSGRAIVEEVLRLNGGPGSLIGIAARHAYEQLTQVAAVVKDITDDSEMLSPMRRRFIQRCLA